MPKLINELACIMLSLACERGELGCGKTLPLNYVLPELQNLTKNIYNKNARGAKRITGALFAPRMHGLYVLYLFY